MGVTSLRIFGSVARGEARPDSDVDMLVDLDPGMSLLEFIGVKQFLEDVLGCEVDLAEEEAMKPRVRDRVLREAVSAT
ncbi:MAG: nucleotidyltransferase family protein [Armatimonadetes bacterium]|nr:nucleotidyltransferase family protein [Armatimonadota bacterium]